mgnify:CR=1 FL=1
MASNWITLKLGDVTKWSSGGTPKKSEASYWDGDIPWISASSMDGHLYTESKLKITEEGLANGTRLAPKGSILLLVRGSILHQKMQVGLTTRAVAFNQDVKCLIANEDYLDPWYLLLWFKAKEQELLAIVESTGIGAGKFDTKLLSKYPIEIPPQDERERIKNFGKALFDKTTNIAKTNQTLEQMAQALFKSWFVNFDPVIDNALTAGTNVGDFPVALQHHAEQRKQALQLPDFKLLPDDIRALFPSEFEQTDEPSIGIRGWIPKGWESKNLSDLLDVKYGKDHKKLSEGQYPVYGSGGLMRSVDKFLYEGESVLIPRKGTLSNIMYVNETFWTVDTMFFTIPKMDNVAKFSFYLLKRLDFNAMNVGSAVPSMTTKVLNSLQLVCPPEKVLVKFDELVELYFSKTRANNENSSQLEKLRDTLLPKLISGELQLPDTEQQVENKKALA